MLSKTGHVPVAPITSCFAPQVTASCPELNAALMALHAARQEGPGDRQRLLALLEGVLGKLDELRANVEFQP